MVSFFPDVSARGMKGSGSGSGDRISNLCSDEAGFEEGGGFKAMMVLLLKQMHLQKDVAVARAAQVGFESDRINRQRAVVSGERGRRMSTG
jgi:hypothetical protein